MNGDVTSLHDLTEQLAAPYATVTVDTVARARAVAPPELWAVLGVDDAGVVEGVARGYWTQVGA